MDQGFQFAKSSLVQGIEQRTSMAEEIDVHDLLEDEDDDDSYSFKN